MPPVSTLDFLPLTPERWGDLETLFGENGACGGCWCMWWRLTGKEFNEKKGLPNKRSLKGLVESGQVPGLLAFAGGEAIGWCSLGPREVFSRLERSPTLKRVDDQPVWSVVCFFVKKSFRHQGVSESLLKAAISYARSRGAAILEGYPLDAGKEIPSAFAYTGLVTAFRKAGFVEVARRSAGRPIMRYLIKDADGPSSAY